MTFCTSAALLLNLLIRPRTCAQNSVKKGVVKQMQGADGQKVERWMSSLDFKGFGRNNSPSWD
jgi:hypothetical protein